GWVGGRGGFMGGGSKTVHLPQGGRGGGVGRGGGSRDLFATLAACGCGRIGCTRHNLAGNALHSRAGGVARWRFSDLAFGQLSRRSARGWSARRRGGGLLCSPRPQRGFRPQRTSRPSRRSERSHVASSGP